MAQTQGYITKLQIAPDAAGSIGALATLAGNPKAKWSTKMAKKTTTSLGGTGDETAMLTIKSFSVSGSTFYDHSDTATQTLEGAGRTQCWAKAFTNATNFMSGPVLVTQLEYDNDAEGIATLNFTLESTGPITTG